MSLLENAYEDFTILNKSIIDDGYGGVTTEWTEGATIQGVMVFDSSAQMKIAQAMGVNAAYTFTIKRHIELDFHTVLRRDSDNKVFRLVSDSDDKKTPNGAGLDMRQYSTEEWQITN